MRKHYIGSLILTVLIAMVVLAPHSANATTSYYVRSGATTGANNGTSWADAYTDLPASLHRDAIYYLANGTYNSKDFKAIESGTSLVTIKKATAADHGAASDWNSAYDDPSGEALFTNTTSHTSFSIGSDYMTVDGVRRNSDWKTGYGIHIKLDGISSSMTGQAILHSHDGAPPLDVNGHPINRRFGLVVRYVNMEGVGVTSAYGTPDGLDLSDTNGAYYSNLYIHDNPRTTGIARSNGVTLEGSLVARNYSFTGNGHSEGMFVHEDTQNLTIRNNRWEDINGTGVIVLNTSSGNTNSGWKVYGNMVYNSSTPFSGYPGDSGDFLYVINGQILRDTDVYNNTILTSTLAADSLGVSALTSDQNSQMINVVVQNNIWASTISGTYGIKNKQSPSGSAIFSNNSYFGTGPTTNAYCACSTTNESGIQMSSTLPFVNVGARDFRLTQATNPTGVTLGLSSYDRTDVAGNIRGADGNWDRGAYEYTGGALPPPPPPPPPSTKFVIGDRVQVTGSNVNVRTSPTTGATSLGTQLIGVLGTVVAGSTADDGYNWWQINYDNSTVDGWSVEDYLTKYTTTADVTPPIVALVAPTANQTVSGNFTLSATASDSSGIQSVKFYINGVFTAASNNSTSPYTLVVGTASAADGNYSVEAVAKDNAGNTATSTAVTMVINNTTVTPPPPPPPGSGLVAAYSFNEGNGSTVTDSSGSGNNGTIANTVWTGAGKFGNALSFNGTNAMVTIPDSTSLDLTTGMTLEAWVNPNVLGSGSNDWKTVILKEKPGYLTYDMYADSGSSGGPRGNIYVTAGSNAPDTNKLTLNTWTHLAVTYDGTTMRLYRNGNLVSSKTVGGNIYVSNGSLRIGGNSVWPTEYFGGLIDEVRVYNRPLSQTEITTDMNTGIGGGTTPPPPPPSGFSATVTAPTNNQIVSGVTTISATASGSNPIQSIQFMINSANTGSPVTTSPYNLAIDTRTAPDGNYTVQAVAKDTLGNATTSPAVTMVISNTTTTPPPPPSGGGIGRGSKIKVTTNKLKVRDPAGGKILGTQSLNAQGIVLDGPIVTGGYTWWKIDYTAGVDGWSVQNYLTPTP